MIKDNRRYYLDLKENSRGRFLRVSQTITRGGPRSQVAIPAQGMIEFRDALTDLLDEFSTDEHAYKPDLPEGRHIHVDNKNFYFDIGMLYIFFKIILPLCNLFSIHYEGCYLCFRNCHNVTCHHLTELQRRLSILYSMRIHIFF